MIAQNRRERPDETGTDRLSAEPAEPEREWHRAPHIRLELHRFQRHLQPRESRRSVAPECQARFITLDENRLQPRARAQRAQLRNEKQALGFRRQWPEPVT